MQVHRDTWGGGGKDGKGTRTIKREARAPRPHAPSEEELARHKAFLEKIKDPLWTQ